MNKNQQFIRLFIALSICTAFILSFSYFGVKAVNKFMVDDGTYSAGTTIGNLNITGKSKDEVKSLLEQSFSDWKRETKISVVFQAQTMQLDLSSFNLDTDQTIDSIQNGQQNTASVIVDQSTLENQLQMHFTSFNLNDIDENKLTNRLSSIAANLETGSVHLDLLTDFYLSGQQEVILNESVVVLKGIPAELQSFVGESNNIDLPAKSTFSFLGFLKENKLKLGTDIINQLATGIYQTILPTNLKIEERNIGNVPPDSSVLGYEAIVDSDQDSDLIFSNPNKVKCTLEFQLNQNQLTITLKGNKSPYHYKISLKNRQTFQPKTIVQYSPMLKDGMTLIKDQGMEGQMVEVYREIYLDGSLVNSELVSEDYYPPVYRIEVHGLASSSSNSVNIQSTQEKDAQQNDPSNPNQAVDNNGANEPVQPNAEGNNNVDEKQNDQSK